MEPWKILSSSLSHQGQCESMIHSTTQSMDVQDVIQNHAYIPRSPPCHFNNIQLQEQWNHSAEITFSQGYGYTPAVTYGMQASSNCTLRHITELPGHLVIIRQPAKEYRFRYKSEGSGHGSILSQNPSEYPAIELKDYPNDGTAIVSVQLYTSDGMHKHFHKLVGPNCSEHGECVLEMENNVLELKNVGINLMKKDHINAELQQKHMFDIGSEKDEKTKKAEIKRITKNLQLDSGRLCFQAYHRGTQQPIGKPVLSECISNAKSAPKILHLSKSSSACIGGKSITMICQNWKKDDGIYFYEEGNSNWEERIPQKSIKCHCQTAVVFNVPAYKNTRLTTPARVFVQLRTAQEKSNKMAFTYKPSKKVLATYNDLHKRGGRRRGNSKTEHLVAPPNFPYEMYDVSAVLGTTPQTSPESESSESQESCSNSQTNGLGYAQQEDLFTAPSTQTVEQIGQWMHIPGPRLQPSISAPVQSYSENFYNHNFPRSISQQETFELPDDLRNISLNEDLFLDDPAAQATAFDCAVPKKKQEEIIRKVPHLKGLSDKGHIIRRNKLAPTKMFSEIKRENDANDAVKMCQIGSEISDETKSVQEPTEVKKRGSRTTCMFTAGEKLLQKEERPSPIISKEAGEKIIDVLKSFMKETFAPQMCQYLREYIKTGKLEHILLALWPLFSFTDEKGNTALHLAVKHQRNNKEFFDNLEPVLRILKPRETINKSNDFYQTPLHMAVYTRNQMITNFLVNHGADSKAQDQYGNTPLHLAVLKKDPGCLKILLSKNLTTENSQDIPTPDLDILNYEGFAALHLCVSVESDECMTVLLDAGADPNVRHTKDGETPLHMAAHTGSPLVETLLYCKELDVNAQDYGGQSPLHLAVRSQSMEIVLVLMKAGADHTLPHFLGKTDEENKRNEDEDLSSEEDDGETALDLAENNPQLLGLLKGTASAEEIMALEKSRSRTLREFSKRQHSITEASDLSTDSDREDESNFNTKAEE